MGLQGFKEYQKCLRTGLWHTRFGFHGEPGKVNQLAARMGLAKSIGGIELTDYKPETAAAYVSVFRVFLSYSAFELFEVLMRGGEKARPNRAEQWSVARKPELVTTLLRHSRSRKLVEFLTRELSSTATREALEALVEGRSDNVLFLAASMRHIFGHGAMTVHADGTAPGHLRKLADATSDHVLRIVDDEFSARVAAVMAAHPAQTPKHRSTSKDKQETDGEPS